MSELEAVFVVLPGPQMKDLESAEVVEANGLARQGRHELQTADRLFSWFHVDRGFLLLLNDVESKDGVALPMQTVDKLPAEEDEAAEVMREGEKRSSLRVRQID